MACQEPNLAWGVLEVLVDTGHTTAAQDAEFASVAKRFGGKDISYSSGCPKGQKIYEFPDLVGKIALCSWVAQQRGAWRWAGMSFSNGLSWSSDVR